MLCIISAFSKEIEPLLSRSGASKKDNNLWTIDRKQILIAAVGIGFLEASLNLNKILTLHSEIRSVIFTGSAGVYPDVPDIEIDDLCTCSDTILCDGAAEMGLGLYASILPKDPLEASYKKIEAKRRARVATLLSLTKDNGLANTIRNNTNAELENMELYGIAKTCLERSVSWNSLIGITNTVGNNGHQEWKQNFKRVANKACDHLFNFLETMESH